ncbi:MAG: HAD family hydrolase [Steroidobacteraceae bacterium]
MRPVQVVLFDVGGVLVQLRGVAALLEWLPQRPTSEALFRTWLQSPAVREFETGRCGADAFAARVVRELGLPVDAAQFLESFVGWPTGLYPGAPELVARIPAECRRALLSNSNALHWPRVMDELGLGALFEHRFVSHLIGRIKPDRDAFEHVIEALECIPDSILFLDDNLTNVEAAREAGMRAARVDGVAGAERALLEAGVIR